MNNTANVMRHTVVPIIFCLLKIKAIKIAVKDRIPNMVVYGYHFTWKTGLAVYCLRSFNCAKQIQIHMNKTVKPGMDIK